MFNLVLKDIIIQKKSFLLALFYIVFFMFVFQSLEAAMFASAIIAFTYILVMGAFAHDDKNKVDIMLNSLPVKRAYVVTSKYLSLFLFMFVGTAAYIIIYHSLTFLNIPLNVYPVTLEGFVGALLGASIMNSIYFPLLFKIGYARAKVINMILFFGFFFGIPALVNLLAANGDKAFVKNLIDIINSQPDMVIALSIIAAALILLLFSYLLSIRFYKQREF